MVPKIIPHLVLVGLPFDLLLDRVNVNILPQTHYLGVEVPQVVHELRVNLVDFVSHHEFQFFLHDFLAWDKLANLVFGNLVRR